MYYFAFIDFNTCVFTFGFRAWVVFNFLIRWRTGAMSNVLILSPRSRCLPGSCFGCVRVWVQSGIEAPGGATCARDLVRYVLCATYRTENTGHFNHCWFCGTQPFRGAPVPRDPDATAARIDVEKLESRRAVVFCRNGRESRPEAQEEDSRPLRCVPPGQVRGAPRLGNGDQRRCLQLGVFPRFSRSRGHVGARSILSRGGYCGWRCMPAGQGLRKVVMQLDR